MTDKAAAMLGRKGGLKQTPAQTKARRINMAKALAARLAKADKPK